MNNKILAFSLSIVLCLALSESKAQQKSTNENPPFQILKAGTVSNIPGKVFNGLQTQTYEAIDLPQQRGIVKEFPSVLQTQKNTEANYPHKRTLLKGESIILEVNGNKVSIDTSHFVTFSSEIEEAIARTPLWIHEDLRFKFRVITNTSHRTKMVELLNSTEKQYLDEVAFMLAHLPYEVLKDSRFLNDWSYLIEDVKMIYTFADSLQYVRLVESGDTATGDWHTTTEYKIKQGSNFIWREIDRYYYYMFVVMPKIEQEGVYVADGNTPAHQRTWGYTWRNYLWHNPDSAYNYMPVNCTTNVASVDTIPRLGEIMQMPEYLWDEKKTYFMFNREFKASDHAMDILGNWASKCIPMDVTSNTDYRPSQPNQIAHKHVGNCHEDALLVAAAARTCLIPLMHIGDFCDDHVWGMFHDGGNRLWNHFEFFRGGCSPGRPDFWGMTNLTQNGSYGWSSSLVQGYVPDGTMINVSDVYSKTSPNANLQLVFKDSEGRPIDGVRVQLYSVNYQYDSQNGSILSAGYLWSDSRGVIEAPVGTEKKYYMKAYHPKFGSVPQESGKVLIVLNTKSVAGQTYYFEHTFGTAPARTTITDIHQEFEADKSVKIDFLAKNITVGNNPIDGQKSTFYHKTGTDALLTAYIVKESEIAKFRNNSSSATAQYSAPFLPSGEYNMPLFKTGKTYIVLSNNSNHTNAVELFYTSDLKFVNSVSFDFKEYVSVEDIEETKNTVTVYPNPASNHITISFSEQLNAPWKVTLFDIAGKALKSVENQNTVSISELSSGIYFVKIQTEGETIIKRIVKE